MAEFLLEIMCEEIPARMQEKAASDLGRLLGAAFEKAGLSAQGIETYSGPRRLVMVADLPLRSPDISEERKGPRTSAPEQALAGFMRGAGISDISQAEIRSDKKGEYYVAMVEKKGRAASDIIADAVPDIMGKFPWPKSMKSGTSTFRWVRPLQSIMCLLGGAVVPFEVNGFHSCNMSIGHRRMGHGPFAVTGFADYRKSLEGKGHVILCACDRKEIILSGAKAACAKAGLALVEDEGLLAEVAGLAEWPTVILGDMDESFLKLPAEVIRLSMRTHQKYFAVRDPKTGKLAPKFIVVANQVAPDGGAQIALGNSRVLSARLDDARFFQAEDVRDGKKLIDNYDRLDGVIFHKKLGTIKDKSERVAALARELAPKVGADPDKAEQAARLAKCDLVTNMVVEFTSLQGQIGRLMYEKEGGDKDIAIAIEEHYKPQGPSDKVPTNPVAVAVALADKLDTLVGFWAIDEKPTGSKDPFALRRAALGVVRIVLENGRNFRLRNCIISQLDKAVLREINEESAYDEKAVQSGIRALEKFGANQKSISKMLNTLASSDDPLTEKFNKRLDENFQVAKSLFLFILDRLKGHLRDSGIHHTHVDAVFALGGDDLVDITSRVTALGSFLSTGEGVNLLAGYKRASNILKAEAKKGALPDVTVGAGNTPEEAALHGAIGKATPLAAAALSAADYAGAMSALAELRGPIDAFFDGVIVNSDDVAERENRLGLLMQIRTLAKTIADFDKIEGA